MNNTTLADFIENPYCAMRNGYYPDFMSCLALKSSEFSIKSLTDTKDDFLEILRDEAIMFPIYFLEIAICAILKITIPICFPVWAVIYWFNARNAFRKYHEKQKKRPRLMINGVEQ